MTLPDGGKKNWLLPVAASLLLHAPVVILLALAAPGKAIPEPDLKLSLRSAPPAQKAAAPPAEARKAQPRPEPAPRPRQQAKTRPGPKPDETKKTAAEPAPGAAASTEPAQSAANQRDMAPTPAERAAGAADNPAPSAGPAELSKLTIIKEVLPDYPAFSRKRSEEGEVRIIVTIKGGTVVSAGIHKSSGHKRLDQSALRAAKQWRFAETGELSVIIPFIFSLTD